MDHAALNNTVQNTWDADVVPSLSDFVRIPAVSPAFDPRWETNGHLDAAIEHLRRWANERDLPGLTLDVVRLPGRTPLLLVDVPAHGGATGAETVLLYGHLDKQPPAGGGREGSRRGLPPAAARDRERGV